MCVTYVSLVFSVWIFLSIQTTCKGEAAKRILMNDPDLINARFTHLEHQLQQFTELTSKMNTKISTLEQQIQQQQQVITSYQDLGSSYIRWGRKSCKDTQTELVYKGYAGGQLYYYSSASTKFGGPSNMLCLPDDPQLTNETFTATSSLVYGTEYEGNFFASNSANEDMPCAVCRNPMSTTTIMIPGRQTCYNGWKIEYNGYIASGHFTQTASNYICIDANPEFITSGQANIDGHLMYMTGIKCGPLPCPPYRDNHKLSCVVCSK